MRIGVVLLFALALGAPAAQGETYPDHAVPRSPNPAGGANDTIVRIIAARMSEILGAPFVIEIRGGGGGKIGVEAAAHAAPDGYTLLAALVSTHSFAPIITAKLAYDPIKDFGPISLFAMVQNVLVVPPSCRLRCVTRWWGSPRRTRARSTTRPAARARPATSRSRCSSRSRHPERHGARALQGRRAGRDGDDGERGAILLRADRRHGAVHRGRLGAGARHQRRGALRPAGCADHGRSRACRTTRRRLVRTAGAGRNRRPPSSSGSASRWARPCQARRSSTALRAQGIEPKSSRPAEFAAFIAEQLDLHQANWSHEAGLRLEQ